MTSASRGGIHRWRERSEIGLLDLSIARRTFHDWASVWDFGDWSFKELERTKQTFVWHGKILGLGWLVSLDTTLTAALLGTLAQNFYTPLLELCFS